MISVIIPAFNAEKYIKRCIDSVLKQTYKDLEIIIVDDGSYDNTPLICDEYSIKHKNFKVFHIENSGVSAARNYGLTQASGEYITFLDADDWIETNCFAEMSKYNTDIIAAGMIFDFGNGKTIKLEGKAGSYSQENFFKNFLLGHTDVHVVNKLFAKRILNGIFFDSSVRVSEDCLFLCRAIINADSIYVLNKSFYHYYQNPYSVMHESFSKKNFDKLKANRCVVNRVYDKTDKDKNAVVYVYLDSKVSGKNFFFADKNKGQFVQLSQEEFINRFECYEKDLKNLGGIRPWEDRPKEKDNLPSKEQQKGEEK